MHGSPPAELHLEKQLSGDESLRMGGPDAVAEQKATILNRKWLLIIQTLNEEEAEFRKVIVALN